MTNHKLQICCAWCLKIYTPINQNIPKDKQDNTFCSQGCIDAEKLYRKYVKFEYLRIHANKLLPKK